jgi:succinate dehydrogenase / fumarate reductase, membrane anchor subunit
VSTMKTPLKVVRGLGSSKSGTEHFWQQRLTALFNVPLLVFFAWFMVSKAGASRAELISSLKHPLIAVALVLTLASVIWHMRLGLQVVIEDYVHGAGRKLTLLTLNTMVAALLFAVSAYSILKMSFAL